MPTTRNAVASCLLTLACAGGGMAVHAAEPVVPRATLETALRHAMQEAVWPADIVRLASDYLREHPRGAWADAARALHERASGPVAVLSRSDVRLYRSAFESPMPSPGMKAELRRAALGDADAAVRLAHEYKRLDGQHAGNRYVGWLQYAAVLGHEKAAYELAVHYRTQDQPVLASQYEARAVALGFVPPSVLDHLRK